MKTHKNLFTQVYSFQNLLLAYKKAKRGARQTDEIVDYFFNLEKKILELSEKIQTQTYKPAEYRYFRIFEPKERTISVASFTDRIVHHAVVNILEPIYEKIFIYHSYATRKNKGTHKAVFKAQEYLRKNQWFLKSDIQKYFDNINHKILLDIISQKISDEKFLNLIKIIVTNSVQKKNRLKKSTEFVGLPIGNLTSQFLANVYLNEFDYFVKHKLKQNFYVRYMDDFVIFNNDKQKIKQILPEIECFLNENLNLKLKPKATIINSYTNGLSFLGTRIYRSIIRIRKENLKRIEKNLNKKIYLFHKNKISENELIATCNSYNSFFDNYNIFSIKNDIFANKGI